MMYACKILVVCIWEVNIVYRGVNRVRGYEEGRWVTDIGVIGNRDPRSTLDCSST